MKFKGVNSNKEINVNVTPYLIKWAKKSGVSGPQQLVNKALYPYWKNHVVLAEFRLPKSLYRADLINLTLKIFLEVSPESTHGKFNKFMHGSRAGYLGVIKRDEEKRIWAENNGFTYVEVMDDDFIEFEEGRVKQWFLDKYQITL